MSSEYQTISTVMTEEETVAGCEGNTSCPLSKDQLLALVKEEEKRRTSQEFLEALEKEEHKGRTDGTEITVKMQEDVVKSFGYPPEIVEVLRSARYWYPGVQEFWDIPLQVRNNIMRECRFDIGDSVPNLELFSLDQGRTNLYAEDDEILTIILAGSFS